MFPVQRAGERAFGAMAAEHVVLLRREQLAPFGVGSGDLEFCLFGIGGRIARPQHRGKRAECDAGAQQAATVEHHATSLIAGGLALLLDIGLAGPSRYTR